MPTPAERPTLSIVVPFHNVEAYIGACLDSIRLQLLHNIEVLMVDDGSSDGSTAIAERFAQQDTRFRLIRQENQGLGPARNTGAAAATGEYVTFCDSDDVVPPRGYFLMINTLENTGSDFAAGNAYRFSATKGVYQSWTHQIPFAETHLNTSIAAHPELIRDRMVWNKVYRRSFWEAGHFTFPPIRYEDYMVTLRAYLEARSVDVLANHVYFWRDRESGDSITQQASRWDNAIDRYLSAGMVLDVLREHQATDEIRERVHAYFIHIDVVALAESMVAVAPEHRTEAERMAGDLAARLVASEGHGITRLARLVHSKLLAGDLRTVRALARWRTSSNHRELLGFLVRQPDPAVVWVAASALLSSRRPQNPLAPRRLRADLEDAYWSETSLHLRVSARLRAQLASGATANAHFVSPSGSKVDAPVTVDARPSKRGLDLNISVDTHACPKWPSTSLLIVEIRRRGLRWQGHVTFEAANLPGVHQAANGWLQLRGFGSDLGLQRIDSPVVIDSVTANANDFQLTAHSFETSVATAGECAAPTASIPAALSVHRPAPSEMVTISLEQGHGRVRAHALVDGDPADDVVTGIAERPVTVHEEPTLSETWSAEGLEGHTESLSVPHEGAEHEDTARYVYLRGPEASIELEDRTVRLSRGAGGMLVVRQESHQTMYPLAD